MKRLFLLLIISAILAASFCGAATVAYAEQNDVAFDFDVTKTEEEITAVVTLTENDGIVDLYLRVEYDTDALVLVDRELSNNVLAKLRPVDNFEEGAYEYPYRVSFVENVANVDDTGRLLTLHFKVKEGAKKGEYPIKLVVRQVGYLVDDSDPDPIYNTKYGDPIEFGVDPTAGTTGGVVVAAKKVAISGGKVASVTAPEEKDGKTALVIGLSVGGAVLFVAALATAYIIYRRKKTNTDTSGK